MSASRRNPEITNCRDMFQTDVSCLLGAESYRPSDSQDHYHILWSRGFITVFTKACHSSPSSKNRWSSRSFFHSVSSKYILLSRSGWSISFRFYNQKPLFCPVRATCPANLILILLITRVVWWRTEHKKLVLMYFSPLSGHFLFVCRVPCFLKHPVFKLRPSRCLCDRASLQYNDVNNQQDATTFSFINLFNSAPHVSGYKFAHPQEHFLTVYTDFGKMRRHCCRSVPRLRWNWHSISTCIATLY